MPHAFLHNNRRFRSSPVQKTALLAAIPDWYAAPAWSRRFRRSRSRSAKMMISNSTICAVSNSEPIGSTESCAALIIGHRLRGNMEDHVGARRRAPRGCAVTTAIFAPASRADAINASPILEAPGPDETNSRSPGANRRHGHIADDMDVEAEMEQPHREARPSAGPRAPRHRWRCAWPRRSRRRARSRRPAPAARILCRDRRARASPKRRDFLCSVRSP